jgi:hypothetical protein
MPSAQAGQSLGNGLGVAALASFKPTRPKTQRQTRKGGVRTLRRPIAPELHFTGVMLSTKQAPPS